jgi:site-specific DNA-methyltransferase (adenine-specific)
VWSCPLPDGEPELMKALRVAVPRRRSVELYQRIMLNHGGQGDVVYLPFAGSGAGLIAAERTHRSAVVLESSTGMVDLILARWEAFTGEAAKKETGNG